MPPKANKHKKSDDEDEHFDDTGSQNPIIISSDSVPLRFDQSRGLS